MPARFPEFTDEVKAGDVRRGHLVLRAHRPQGPARREILFADYTFLNKPLAKHYGVTKEIKSTERRRTGGRRE